MQKHFKNVYRILLFKQEREIFFNFYLVGTISMAIFFIISNQELCVIKKYVY